LYDLERYDDAIEKHNNALELKRDGAEAYNGLGWALLEKEEYAKAADAFQKASSLKPDDASFYTSMGWALAYNRDFPEAFSKFEKSIELNPNNPDAYHGWGSALVSQGTDYGMAAQKFRRSLDLRPDPEVYEAYGWALYNQDKFEEATEKFQRAVDLVGGRAAAHMGWAWALLGQESPESPPLVRRVSGSRERPINARGITSRKVFCQRLPVVTCPSFRQVFRLADGETRVVENDSRFGALLL
jgi:tetratricopeptide (TPR) repeat protein